jgi:DNA-directed RNA polymerase subunit RPC12/RpoP
MSTSTLFSVGEQPGTGNYRCTNCGQFVAELIQPKDQLPPCENCGANPAVKYEIDNREAAISHGP